jgi:ubiquinone/menaquinone biosynthesis C-methylase UbiE
MSHDHAHSRRFDPAGVARLEDPERPKIFPVDHILALAGITAGQTVADIGAGSGYFAIPIARAVAPARVFAVDVSPEMLDYLRAKLTAADHGNLSNIELVRGEANATSLPVNSCDIVFTSAVWHEIDDYPTALSEFARILRPGGRLVIVDWSPEGQRPPGPPIEHRVSLATVRATLVSAQWRITTAESINTSVYVVVASRP